MAELPHFAWPMQFVTLPDGGVTYATVEQDTDADLEASAAIIACTPRGWRDDDPTFGVSSPVFEQGPIDTDRLAAELAQADDRLDVDVDEVLDLANAMNRQLAVSVGRSA